MTRRALEADDSPANFARQVRRALSAFDLEIANHFELEETLLFPAIERELGPHPLIPALLAEHRELERLAALLRGDAPARDTLFEFLELLRRHIRAEENELFEDVQNRLAPETMQRLGAEFEARAVRLCIEP